MYIKMFLAGLVFCVLLFPISVSSSTCEECSELYNDNVSLDKYLTHATFVTTARVNLRQSPTTNSARVRLIDNARIVRVIDFRDGNWFLVSYNGIQGYMYSEFLEAQVPNCLTCAPYRVIADVDSQDEPQTTFITTTNVNLRPNPSTYGTRITLVGSGRRVEVLDFRDGTWFKVDYNGQEGYMYASFLRELPQPGQPGTVELIEWSAARNIIPQNTPLTVIDVRTGLSLQMISFSHGNHADMFPATAADTEILRQAFGGRWDWTPRPVLLIVGDRTFAASLNGMPHGSGSNRNNNMAGHVCMHFLGSRTHNGNRSHERDHQNAVQEAFNTASNW